MSLLNQIAAARMVREAQGVKAEIPLAPTQSMPLGSSITVKEKEISNEVPLKVPATTKLSLSQPPQARVNVAPAVVPPVMQLQPLKAASPVIISSPQAPSALDVELDTFNLGTEKYTPQEVEQIKSSLEFMRSQFEHPEIVGEAMKTIMMSINENPHLADILEHKDIGTMVRAMRESYGIHVAKAETRKAGGSGSRGGKKKPGELEVDLGLGNIFGGN